MVTVTGLSCNLTNEIGKGNKMKNTTFDEIITWHIPSDWDHCLASLPEAVLDHAVYTWLATHKTWLDDCFPECAYDRSLELLNVLYRDGTDQQFAELMIQIRQDYSEKHQIAERGNKDVFYFSEATGDFESDSLVGAFIGDRHLSFAECYRNDLYLWLEDRIEGVILDEMGLEHNYGGDL